MVGKKKEGKPRDRPKRFAKAKPPTELQQVFACNVLAAREAAGLSQKELGRLAGTTQRHVSDVEVAARNVTLSMVSRYARALGVEDADLLTLKSGKPSER